MAVGPRITIVTVLADLNLVRSTYAYTCMQERDISRFFFYLAVAKTDSQTTMAIRYYEELVGGL